MYAYVGICPILWCHFSSRQIPHKQQNDMLLTFLDSFWVQKCSIQRQRERLSDTRGRLQYTYVPQTQMAKHWEGKIPVLGANGTIHVLPLHVLRRAYVYVTNKSSSHVRASYRFSFFLSGEDGKSKEIQKDNYNHKTAWRTAWRTVQEEAHQGKSGEKTTTRFSARHWLWVCTNSWRRRTFLKLSLAQYAIVDVSDNLVFNSFINPKHTVVKIIRSV